eukprot:UN01475
MESLVVFSLLASTFSASGPSFLCYTKVFEDKWPSCQNIACWNDADYFFTAAERCADDSSCIGFSSNGGHGCLKRDQDCDTNGMSDGAYDFWVELADTDCASFLSSSDSSCYKKVWDNEWPNCANVACFTGKTKAQAKAMCDAQSSCIGFSYSTVSGNGGGCLKKDQLCAAGGLASGSYSYF